MKFGTGCFELSGLLHCIAPRSIIHFSIVHVHNTPWSGPTYCYIPLCGGLFILSLWVNRDILGYGSPSDNRIKAVSRDTRNSCLQKDYRSYLSCGFLLTKWGSQSIFLVYWWPRAAPVFHPIPELWQALWKMPRDVLSPCCPALVEVPCCGFVLSAPLSILCIN